MVDHLTIERLKEVLHYDAELGAFTWRHGYRWRKEGEIAGKIHPTLKYRLICIDSKQYPASKLAWFYVHEVWPREVDHIDGERANDRIVNLLEVSRSQNCWNSAIRSHNTSGRKGVYFDKQRGKWLAYIRKYGKMYSLGRYASFEEACRVRAAAEKRFHGEFARAA